METTYYIFAKINFKKLFFFEQHGKNTRTFSLLGQSRFESILSIYCFIILGKSSNLFESLFFIR